VVVPLALAVLTFLLARARRPARDPEDVVEEEMAAAGGPSVRGGEG